LIRSPDTARMMIHGPTDRTAEPEPTEPPAQALRAAYRGLRAIGLTEFEAGNLSAHLAGLGQVTQGWKLAEIERLLFIRSLVETGRIDS
jgi:hypothetical protein